MGILMESCLFWFFVDGVCVVLVGIGKGLWWLGRTVWGLFAWLYHEIRSSVHRLIGRRKTRSSQRPH